MKRKGDFTSLSNNLSAIAAARAAGMPADKVLGLADREEADAAARYDDRYLFEIIWSADSAICFG